MKVYFELIGQHYIFGMEAVYIEIVRLLKEQGFETVVLEKADFQLYVRPDSSESMSWLTDIPGLALGVSINAKHSSSRSGAEASNDHELLCGSSRGGGARHGRWFEREVVEQVDWLVKTLQKHHNLLL